MDQCDLSPESLVAFLHENYLRHFCDTDDLVCRPPLLQARLRHGRSWRRGTSATAISWRAAGRRAPAACCCLLSRCRPAPSWPAHRHQWPRADCSSVTPSFLRTPSARCPSQRSLRRCERCDAQNAATLAQRHRCRTAACTRATASSSRPPPAAPSSPTHCPTQPSSSALPG